jgi:hypothetical protein
LNITRLHIVDFLEIPQLQSDVIEKGIYTLFCFYGIHVVLNSIHLEDQGRQPPAVTAQPPTAQPPATSCLPPQLPAAFTLEG